MAVAQSSPTRSRKSSYHHGDLENALLEAAEIELTENGVERFSLRSVAKRASVSHGAPAHHFGDVQGLLTALAARGYARFIAAQDKREGLAEDNPRAKLAASGLGYLDFATDHPALFRLMFASERTDKSHPTLADAANRAFDKLTQHVEAIRSKNPHGDQLVMADVLACWAVAHGLADLLIADRLGRATFLAEMSQTERDDYFASIILRGIPQKGGTQDESSIP